MLVAGHALTKAMLTHVSFPKDPKNELLFPKVVFTTEEAADIKRVQAEGMIPAPYSHFRDPNVALYDDGFLGPPCDRSGYRA